MSNKGWIKLYRELLDKSIWKDIKPERKVILITILLMASHKENYVFIDNKRIKIKSGQFISSYSKIAERCGKGVSYQMVRSCLLVFKNAGFLTYETTNKYIVITIENWELYQENIENQQPNQQTINNQSTTIKNIKNENNIIYSEIISKFNSTCIELSKVKKLTDTRKRRINSRIKEYDKETVLEVINIVSKTSFLNGNNNTGWKANFDWIMNSSNFTKILEGNYHSKEIVINKETGIYNPDDSQLKW
ncbi:phage protein [Clostridioides difficile]|nr:phage protein [Clostridioides difficile]